MIKPDKKAKGKEVDLVTAVIHASSSLDESLGSSLKRGLSQLTSTGASQELDELKKGQKKLKTEVSEIKRKLRIIEGGIGEILELIRSRDK